MFNRRRPLIAIILMMIILAGCAGQKRSQIDNLYREGQYDQGIQAAEENLRKVRAAKGDNNLETAANMNLLAKGYHSMGDFAKAEPLFKKALAIRERNLGPNDLQVAVSLDNLAGLYADMGDFAKAEPLYKRALKIREQNLADDHPDVAVSLNNLATLYYYLGDIGQAIPLYERSTKILEERWGDNSPDLATSLDNLGGMYASIGRFDEAEPLFKRALKIRKNTLRDDHPDLAVSLNNMGWFYLEKKDFAQAESYFTQALAITKKAVGPDHPRVGTNMNNLAVLYASQKKYGPAEDYYRKSIAIWEKAYGPAHPDVAEGLNNLALLFAEQGRYREAHDLFTRAQAIDKKVIDQVLGFTSEEKKTQFLALKQTSMEQALSMVAQHMKTDPKARRDAYNVWLARKGIILEAQRRYQEALVQSDDPKTRQVFGQLGEIRAELSRLTFSGPGPEGPDEYRRKLTELDREKSRLEAELSRLSQAFATKRKVDRADAGAVSRALPAGSVLLDFARISYVNFRSADDNQKWLPAHYLAFVLTSGSGGDVKMIDLGPADDIDRTITRFKKAVMNVRRDQEGKKAISAAKSLYSKIWAPVTPLLEDVDRVFISPDGSLNLIPFEVMAGPDGRFLIDDYRLNYLSAGRDVIGFGQVSAKSGKSILIGDPNFDLTSARKSQITAKLGIQPATGQSDLRSLRAGSGFKFSRLPGTKGEVEAIRNILGPESTALYTGDQALEEVLRNAAAPPRILHLATHGFFLSDMQFAVLTGKASRKRSQSKEERESSPMEFNPLVRSGLALAGANYGLSGGGVGGDGIFTAEEVLALKLRGTDMVVLSACETGLGEIMSGEGVYGLRRVFTQAGAKSLVMSMWSVPDKETEELMLNFYRNIIDGMARDTALREAVLQEKKNVRERYGHDNPFFWGAFVYLGQP